MTEPWKSFLLIRLPLALLSLALLVEVAAWLLRDAPTARHPLDQLVLGLDQGPFEADFLLLGDSVTQDVADTYRLAPEGALVNATTNQASGIAGSYLLLRRYLSDNPAPRRIAVIATPEFLGFVPDGPTAAIYLTSVFTRPGEPAFLDGIGLMEDRGPWKPAVLDIDSRVLDPMIGYAVATPSPVNGGVADPMDAGELEGPGGNAVSTSAIASRSSRLPAASPGAAQALAALCRAARDVGARLVIAWAPMPESIWREWEEGGVLSAWRARLLAAGDGACADVVVDDFNRAETYPDHAFRDSDHLRRPGWTAHYARDLARWIAERRAE